MSGGSTRNLTVHYVRRQYHCMDNSTGVGVLDKSVALLDSVATGPQSLAHMAAITGIPRATAHRLAVALEHHGLLSRDDQGRFEVGPRLSAWSTARDHRQLLAEESVNLLCDRTGLSAQAYRRLGQQRLCIAAAEPRSGLRDTVPVGSLLTLAAGSGAQVLVAWLPESQISEIVETAMYTAADLAIVRQRGWAHSVSQREAGVASMSAPVFDDHGTVVMAVSLSGPSDRLEHADDEHRDQLLSEVARLSAGLTALPLG